MDTVWGYARAVLIGILLVMLLLRLFEDRFVFFPFKPSPNDPDPRRYGLVVEDVFFRTADGVDLHGWYAAAPEARFTVLYFHGNAGNLSYRIDNIVFLRALPVHVFAVDYRGFGRSQGKPTEVGLYLDAEAAYEYLVEKRGVVPERLLVLGQSLGVSVAAELAARRPVAGLILEGGFPSAPRVAQRVMWLPGLHRLMRNRLDAAANLRRLRVPFDPASPPGPTGGTQGTPGESRGVPVLVAHGAGDSVIPFDLGEELFRAANEPKTFVRLEGDYHEPLFFADPEGYAQSLRDFLARIETSEKGAAKP